MLQDTVDEESGEGDQSCQDIWGCAQNADGDLLTFPQEERDDGDQSCQDIWGCAQNADGDLLTFPPPIPPLAQEGCTWAKWSTGNPLFSPPLAVSTTPCPPDDTTSPLLEQTPTGFIFSMDSSASISPAVSDDGEDEDEYEDDDESAGDKEQEQEDKDPEWLHAGPDEVFLDEYMDIDMAVSICKVNIDMAVSIIYVPVRSSKMTSNLGRTSAPA